MNARRILRLAHGWMGAVLALFVLLIAGSGVGLAFMPELFKAQYGQIVEAKSPGPDAAWTDVDAIIASAQRGFGGPFEVYGVLMPDSRVQGLDVAMVYGVPEGQSGFEATTMLSVDPYTATYRGKFLLDDAWGHQLVHFHHDLYGGEIGTIFVAALGVLLVVFAASGLWLWWPRDGRVWRKARQLELRRGDVWFSLHGWVGVWASVLILFFALSGTAVSKPDWFGPLLRGAPEAPPSEAGFARRCSGVVTPGSAATTALAANAGRQLTYVDPGAGTDPHRMTLRAPGDVDRIEGGVTVFAHAECPGLTWRVARSDQSFAERAQGAMLSLHGGYAFGPMTGDLMVILGGISLVMLTISGVIAFFRRTLRRRARVQTASLAPAE